MGRKELSNANPMDNIDSVFQGDSESVSHTLHDLDQGQQSLLKDCGKKTYIPGDIWHSWSPEKAMLTTSGKPSTQLQVLLGMRSQYARR